MHITYIYIYIFFNKVSMKPLFVNPRVECILLIEIEIHNFIFSLQSEINFHLYTAMFIKFFLIKGSVFNDE